MFRELYTVVTTVVGELMFSGPNLILLPHPPVVPLLFHLLRADGNGNWGGGALFREAEWVSAEFIFSQCKVPKPELNFLASISPLIFSLYSIINMICVIMLEVIINQCLC